MVPPPHKHTQTNAHTNAHTHAHTHTQTCASTLPRVTSRTPFPPNTPFLSPAPPHNLHAPAALLLQLPHLEAGDIVIDGGNSEYQDTTRRTKALKEKGILFVGTG